MVGEVTRPPNALDGPCGVQCYSLDRMHRLTSRDVSVWYRPTAAQQRASRARVWRERPREERQRADGLDPEEMRNTILQHRPPRKVHLRYGGAVSSHRVNPSQWEQKGWKTLSDEKKVSLQVLQNHHIYAIHLSRLFWTGEAMPRPMTTGGVWRRLLPSATVRQEGHAAFTHCRTQLLPRRALQSVYNLHADVQSTLQHAAGEGHCELCLAQGHQRPDTSWHRVCGCPLRTLVYQMVSRQWALFDTQASWPSDLLDDDFGDITTERIGADQAWDTRLVRALALGLRPKEERARHRQQFAAARGLMMAALDDLTRATWHARQQGTPPLAADLYRAAAQTYSKIRESLQTALKEDRARIARIEQCMIAAGLKLSNRTPTDRWAEEWSKILGPDQGQILLKADPWPAAGRRGMGDAPRPDWAPTSDARRSMQVYVAARGDGSAWALSAVHQGDGRRDVHAIPLWDAGGPVTTDDDAATWRGARQHTRPAATIHAVSVALERLASARRGDRTAVTIRVAHSECRLIAGMDFHTSRDLDALDEMRRRWRAAASVRQIFLAEWDALQLPNGRVGHVWGLRAATLAAWCADGVWGQLPTAWDPSPRLGSLPFATEDCPICLEPFTDPLPRPRGRARAPHLYGCDQHAACVTCERRYQQENRHTCGLCRAARTLRLRAE
jgi:hypothetical protein